MQDMVGGWMGRKVVKPQKSRNTSVMLVKAPTKPIRNPILALNTAMQPPDIDVLVYFYHYLPTQHHGRNGGRLASQSAD